MALTRAVELFRKRRRRSPACTRFGWRRRRSGRHCGTSTTDRAFDRKIEISIVENDEERVSAELDAYSRLMLSAAPSHQQPSRRVEPVNRIFLTVVLPMISLPISVRQCR